MSQIKYYHNGNIMEEYIDRTKITYHTGHRLNEVVHHNESKQIHGPDNKPGYLKFDLSGNMIFKIYYKNGKCHRDNDKPAFIKYTYNAGIRYIKEIKYYILGEIKRPNDEPTHLIYYKNSDNIKYAKYKCSLYYNYSCWNSNNPINIMVDNYLIHRKSYYEGSHRVDKPGLIMYNKDGTIRFEIYYNKGKIHRYEGYAKILHIKDGYNLKFINNKMITDKNSYINEWSKMFASNLI